MISQHYVFISLSALITLYQFFPRSSGLGPPSLHTHLHIPLPTQAGTRLNLSQHTPPPATCQTREQSISDFLGKWMNKGQKLLPRMLSRVELNCVPRWESLRTGVLSREEEVKSLLFLLAACS